MWAKGSVGQVTKSQKANTVVKLVLIMFLDEEVTTVSSGLL